MVAARGVRGIAVIATLVLGTLTVSLAGVALWFHSRLVASLPRLEGTVALEGLDAPVRVERDALGRATIRARSFEDASRALGYVHAQERFFQMDLARRFAAGELAALLGERALATDRRLRPHRFREVARRVLERASVEERRAVEAYAEAARRGLADLPVPPPEYLLLRATPEPWQPEDCVLVALAMYVQLQDEDGRAERALGTMHEVFPPPLFDFLAPRATSWDTPVDGGMEALPPVPGAEVFDLRTAPASPSPSSAARPMELETAAAAGSNNWAVAGDLTEHGGALLANDMHLGLAVPNPWYYARLVWEGPEGPRWVAGVTLPGVPGVIAGSNGAIAWGFTNSYGDWSDLVLVEEMPGRPDAYLTPEGTRPYAWYEETLQVRDGEPRTVRYAWTLWGPLVSRDHRGRGLALRWVAHEPEATNFRLIRLATARTVEEALAIAPECGAPAQNLVVADRFGRVGWTILGRIPRRFGFEGRLPASWADGTRGWRGWVPPDAYPRILLAGTARLWTANNRVVSGAAAALIGDGGWSLGARARQIRDRLFAREHFDEKAFLEIQLDDAARFLERWRQLLLETLDEEALAGRPDRRRMRELVERRWEGRAEVGAVAYRLVREFRDAVVQRVLEPFLARCRAVDPEFRPRLPRVEGPVWALVQERPAHLLSPAHGSWRALLLEAADEVLRSVPGEDAARIADWTWGSRNRIEVRHPLSGALPGFLRGWLDMPALALPGDLHMPRVQTPYEGASMRMVVAPGREEHGIFHMPCGQSGHPLSPHYRDWHRAWAAGEPTPFLPGPPARTLRLEPPAQSRSTAR